MANATNPCPAPFLSEALFNDGGFVDGRLCQEVGQGLRCCLPCPMTDWAYPDEFNTLGEVAQWVAVAGTACCVFLLLSWIILPVEKTHRHYLSLCLTTAVLFMNLGFVIPLAAQPDECYDAITPNSMQTNSPCAVSGAFLIFGGWGGVMWVFLRSLSLHLQICWQVVVGRNFMWFSQATGWGIPIIGIIMALVFSGVSFRFGSTCHINHENSLADLWVPLLIFAGLTIFIQFATFGYCIKVYLASLADNSASTENSNLPSYTNSIRTMTPKQAYRRVRRVIQLQWRGIAIVLIIVTDVVLFSVVFVFQDNTVEAVRRDPSTALEWVACLAMMAGDKHKCLDKAGPLVVDMPTVGAVLLLLSINGLWLLLLLGRWSMVTGWRDLLMTVPQRNKREFVSVDARMDDLKKDTRSYEMLSRENSGKKMDDSVTPSVVTPISPTYSAYNTYSMRSPINGSGGDGGYRSPSLSRNNAPGEGTTSPGPRNYHDTANRSGRRTPDYFGSTARYHVPTRSFSSPRPPRSPPPTVTWDARDTYARASPLPDESPYGQVQGAYGQQPMGMNRI
ncbi:hypothetical protein GE21DRAFT_1311 [Neurospora crassa]|uniref:G-protein coupled receptors family 2 profile 2 domain-containing protein n=1 Tax=Neurospora crassa (strain ATCC 24698 / 74-OR23-1A / CBS 708.71 / DSM 1257 / FGSC 987) TaxID=367110 RepID=Q7SEH4_NEUCR|nr:hypothetical protein NCU03253 [Neurospora crassa OR74A]EAA35170.3 hypothetical protein NCU03253 [Neurospora crassa OR74A]KHE79852.1 hypothetical protein GE21DRAFT_1311 [Neurospora crassa]|eukprot:XP_964406.3 hypothetical protein NCU03253 [Neurospora crassa OR74A]